MAGQQGQPKYGFGWPDGRLGGLGPPGQREARPLITIWFWFCNQQQWCSGKISLVGTLAGHYGHISYLLSEGGGCMINYQL